MSSRSLIASASAVFGIVVLGVMGLSNPTYVEDLMERCHGSLSLSPKDLHLQVPGLDRYFCLLVPYFVDCSRTDIGRMVIQGIMSFVIPFTFLMYVEASRRGAAWSFLACTPFASVFSFLTGIGIYAPIFFVPSVVHIRSKVESSAFSSAVPLARTYALLTSLVILMVVVMTSFVPGPSIVGEEKSWIPQSVVLNVLVMTLMWFFYTPLTFLIQGLMPTASDQEQDAKSRKIIRNTFYALAGLSFGSHLASFFVFLSGTTPLERFVQMFDYEFRLQNPLYQPAQFLFWDFFGAFFGGFFWVLSDALNMTVPLVYLVLAIVASPGAAMMLYAAQREQRLLDTFTRKTKAKVQ